MNRCLSTYSPLPGEGFSAGALTRLSDGRNLPTVLPLDRAEIGRVRIETMTQMSISGVQDKISLRLHRGTLEPTASGGDYILKPVPSTPLPAFQGDVPANESLTMQLAEQIFGIRTAANTLIRLRDGELAYLTRRFDRTRDGGRVAQEDFAQLMGRTTKVHGPNYKYDATCIDLAGTLRRFCSTYAIEVEKLFRRLLFNFLIGNGDAHLKNFSLQQTDLGDYILSPAYDLLCTRLHIPGETRLALDLLDDDEVTRGEQTRGFVTGADFLDFARRIGMHAARAERFLEEIVGHEPEVDDLIERSFLTDAAKQRFCEEVAEGRQMLSSRK